MSRRTKLWTGIVVLLVVVLVPAAMVLRSWMNSDSSGTVAVGKPAGSAADSNAQPVDISNNWFSAALPAGFTIKSQQSKPADPIEQYSVDALNGGMQTELTISYGPMSGGLNGLSAYNLRTMQTNNYVRYSVPGEPAGSVAFRDLNNPYSAAAYVVFWPRGGSCATIALTGGLGATLDQLNTTFQQLIRSWQWK